MPTPLLQLDRVEKQFAGVRALKPLSLAVEAGEVLGLIGENGAGKSTLIKILSGVHRPDSGSITWQGREVRYGSPHEAISTGIATIHQELAYCGHLSVAENMLLGEPWPRQRWGGIDWAALHTLAAERLARFELDIPTHRFFMELSPAQKQEVAIARALSQKARLLILDEPTASLSEPDVQRLFVHLQRLRREGVAMIYVSHRLDEILQLADRVAVLRDGELISVYPIGEATVLRMVKDMVGRPLSTIYPHTRPAERGEPLIELDNVGCAEMFRGISLQVHAGEIVGLAGLVGAGRSELARAIYGLYPIDSGTMRVRGQPWKPTAPQESVARGVVYLPEERKRQGLVLDHSVGDSISIGFSDLLTRWGLISRSREHQQISQAMKAYDVRASGPSQTIGNLSGGNQQKAMLARWLERGPSVLILDEPTRGVDVGAKAEIHGLIDRLAARKKGVLLISSDLPEVLGLSDRVLVMHAGRIALELTGSSMTQENVLLAASGLSPGS
jgi:ABC-type sugar transport system ATPase subunit